MGHAVASGVHGHGKADRIRAVVVAQLVEQSLPSPVCGSNPNIGKVLSTNCELNRKDENNEKEAGNGPSF